MRFDNGVKIGGNEETKRVFVIPLAYDTDSSDNEEPLLGEDPLPPLKEEVEPAKPIPALDRDPDMALRQPAHTSAGQIVCKFQIPSTLSFPDCLPPL